MSVCSVNARNGQPSILHSNLFRHYNVALDVKDDINDYVLSDWVNTITPEFEDAHKTIIEDVNGEPMPFYTVPSEVTLAETGVPEVYKAMEDLSDEEVKLYAGNMNLSPSYLTEDGVSIPAVQYVKPNPIHDNPMPLGDVTDQIELPFARVRAFAGRLSRQFNIPFTIVNEKTAAELFEVQNAVYHNQPAFISDNRYYLVEGKAGYGHAFHELFGHPFLDILYREDPNLFGQLSDSILQDKSIRDYVWHKYPDFRAGNDLNSRGKKEAVLRAMELEVNNRLIPMDKSGAIRHWIGIFWNWVKRKLGIRFGEFDITSATSVKAIVDAVLDGKYTDLTSAELSGLHLAGGTEKTGQQINLKRLNKEDLDNYLREQNIFFFEMAGTTELQIAKAKIIKELAGDLKLVNDPTEGESYISSSTPGKKFKRGTEVVQNVFAEENMEETDAEYAKNRADKYFINRKIMQPSKTSAVTVEFQGRQVTYNQLLNEFLKQRNNWRMRGRFRHKVLEYAFNPTPENLAQIQKLGERMVSPTDPSVIIYDGFADWKAEFELWLEPTEENKIAPIQKIRELFSLNKDTAAIILTEQIVQIPELDIATTADLLIIYPNGEYGFVDYKFGNLQGGVAGILLRYSTMANTSENLAIMQMVLRMLAVRNKDGEGRFRIADIVRMMDRGDRVEEINDFILQPFLSAIGTWIRDNHKEVYKDFNARGLFDANDYWGSSKEVHDWVDERIKESEEETTREKLSRDYRDPDIQLAMITESIINLYAKIQRHTGDRRYEQAIVGWNRKLAEDTKVYLAMHPTGINSQELYSFKDDTNWAIMANLNKYDQTDPGVQAIVHIGNNKQQEMNKRLHIRDKIHKQLMEAVVDDHKARVGGMVKISVFGPHFTIGAKNYYKGDGTGVFDFLYVEEPLDGETIIRLVSKHQDAARWNKMTAPQKAYHKYVTETMEKAYNTTLGQRMITLHAKTESKAKLLGISEKWDPDNAMVFVPMMGDELKERGMGIVDRVKEGYYNMFYTGEYSTPYNKNAGMPVKYISQPPSVRKSKQHSLNMQHMFERFTEHMWNIELYEDLYAASKGVAAAIDFKNASEGRKVSSLGKWMEDYSTAHILKASREDQEIQLKIRRGVTGEARILSGTQIGETLRNLTTYTTIGLSPVLAGTNLLLTTMLNWKTAGVNALVKKLHGVKVSFGPTALAKGYMAYLKLKSDMAFGREDDNKLYQFMKKYKLTPADMTGITKKEDMVYSKQTFLSGNTLMSMQSLTEHMALISILGGIMHESTFTKGGKQVSLMDSLKIEEKMDPDTGHKYKDVVWVGGIRGALKVQTAGDSEQGKDRIVEVGDLTAQEINAIKRMTVELTGDYRQDEKAPADNLFWWQMTWQFKKFLRRYLLNALSGRKDDPALGHYIETGKMITLDDGTQTPEMVWMKEVTQGWINLFAHQALAWLLYAAPDTFSGIAKALGKSEDWINDLRENYKWSKLSDHQKMSVYKGAVNAGMMMAAFILTAGWEDDDDPIKRRLKGIMSDLTEGMNLTDLSSAFKYTMPTVNKMSKFLTSGFTILASTITQDYTKEGNLRGMADVANLFGPSSSYRQIQAIADHWDEY